MCRYLSGFYDQKKCEFLIVPLIDSHSQIAKILKIDEDSERYWRFECVPPMINRIPPKGSLDGWSFVWDEQSKTSAPMLVAPKEHLAEHFKADPYVTIPVLLANLYKRFIDLDGFLEKFLIAIKKGATGEFVLPRFLLAIQKHNRSKFSGEIGIVIDRVITVLKNWIENGVVDVSAAESAAESAWSAAKSVWSAAESAEESAWSAATSAWSAAKSAWSAAESAATSAWSAKSAWSAAESAESAWSATESAWSAEKIWQAKTLLEIMASEK